MVNEKTKGLLKIDILVAGKRDLFDADWFLNW